MPLLECDNGHLFNGDKYGDTCPNCGLKVSEKKEQEREKTPEELAEELYVSEQSYVCGWLVCIHGANKGRAYEIHPGKNFIGSSDKMDIRVLGDQRIEKFNHASISYDAKDRKDHAYARRLQRNGLLSGTGGLSADPAGAVPYH